VGGLWTQIQKGRLRQVKDDWRRLRYKTTHPGGNIEWMITFMAAVYYKKNVKSTYLDYRRALSSFCLKAKESKGVLVLKFHTMKT
jgi:hypothetical protein